MRPALPALAAGWMWLVAVLAAAAGDARARARIDRMTGPENAGDEPAGPRRGFPARRDRRSRRPGDPAEAAAAWGDLARSIASGLRAGRTITRSLEEAASSADVPRWLGVRLRSCLELRAVGIPLDRALGELAEPPSDEAELLLTLLRVGRRAGAGLPSLLDEFSASMRERSRVAGEIRALTTQARLSGRVLCLLPVGFLGFVLLSSGRDVIPVLLSPAGVAALVGGGILQVLGAWWIRSIVRVEV